MIVLDTSALSMVFRRGKAASVVHPVVEVFKALVQDDHELRIPGVVFQELLSGVRSPEAADQLENALQGFQLLLADRETHRRAAELQSRCRSAGVAAASFDCLIAAHTVIHQAALLTLDQDFLHMAPIVGLRLHPTDLASHG